MTTACQLSKPKATERVDEALQMVGLTDRAQEHPSKLSGGMQQRVQIARVLAMRPSVLLMDEPLGTLDAMTKATLQDQLQHAIRVGNRSRRVQAATGTTVAGAPTVPWDRSWSSCESYLPPPWSRWRRSSSATRCR